MQMRDFLDRLKADRAKFICYEGPAGRKTGAIVYQIKVFTASSPAEVERRANRWLQDMKDEIHLIQVSPTDVVQISAESGLQRFTLVLVYEAA